MKSRSLLLAVAAVASTCRAEAGEELRNWFDDPFFQISAAVADCPTPAGPFVNDSDRRLQAHRRAEKGTTCWLARECERPNAYAYDQDIARAFQATVRDRNPFPDTTLWVTVQGRVLYIEGCAAHESQIAELEAFARALPHVQQAIAIVRIDPSARAPYKLRTDHRFDVQSGARFHGDTHGNEGRDPRVHGGGVSTEQVHRRGSGQRVGDCQAPDRRR